MNKRDIDLPLLKVEGLKKYYPVRKGIFSRITDEVRAVDGVDFHIYEGETFAIVGESGCGKSTIGRSIVSLEKPSEGNIFFKGKDISNYSSKEMLNFRKKVQIIFQDPYSSLNPKKTIYDILSEPLKVHKLTDDKEISKEINKLLDVVGIPMNYQNRYPHEFSGGQRQRIGIARALSLKPRLIVCDEPVSALDVSIQAQVLNLLKNLQKEFNFAYLFIAHGLGAVKYISNRIAVMYLGKIVEIGSTEEIFFNAIHPYTKALISAYPIPNPHSRNKERITLQGDIPSAVNPPKGCRFHTRCPIAKDICKLKEPILRGSLHKVACFAINNLKE